jgi:hypothetical protein
MNLSGNVFAGTTPTNPMCNYPHILALPVTSPRQQMRRLGRLGWARICGWRRMGLAAFSAITFPTNPICHPNRSDCNVSSRAVPQRHLPFAKAPPAIARGVRVVRANADGGDLCAKAGTVPFQHTPATLQQICPSFRLSRLAATIACMSGTLCLSKRLFSKVFEFYSWKYINTYIVIITWYLGNFRQAVICP